MGTLRLSDAIRLGAMLGPQARGALTRRRRKYFFFGPIINEYCAFGGAFVASGAKSVVRTYESAGPSDGAIRGVTTHKAGETYTVIEHPWVVLTWLAVGCPLCPGEVMPLFRLIPHLNDDHRWTREKIADFVQSIEEATDPTKAETREDQAVGC